MAKYGKRYPYGYYGSLGIEYFEAFITNHELINFNNRRRAIKSDIDATRFDYISSGRAEWGVEKILQK